MARRRVKPARHRWANLEPPMQAAAAEPARQRQANGEIVTFALFRDPAVPPAPADATGSGTLVPMFARGRQFASGDGLVAPSHLLITSLGLVIRDGDSQIGTPGDRLYVPDANGVLFRVYAVVRQGQQQWCYLRRETRGSGPVIPY